MNVASQSSFLTDASQILTDKSLINNNNNNNNNENKKCTDDDKESKVLYFNKIIASNQQYQKLNAFSNNWAEIKNNRPLTKLNKNDPTYGIPLNEKTLKRGVAAHNHIFGELEELIQIIKQSGVKSTQATEEYTIKFGILFSIYNRISNKLVGLLLRSRKHGFVDFPGEVLFQGRDDNVIIRLLRLN